MDDWEDDRLGRKVSRVVILLLMLMMLRYIVGSSLPRPGEYCARTASRAWYSMVQPDAAWYSLVQPGTAWYSLVKPGTAYYSLVQPGTAWYSLVKIGSPFGPLFEYFGSPSKMGTVPPPLPHLPQDAEWRVGLGDGEGEQQHCDELLADVMTSSLLSTVSESEEGCTGEVGDRPWWFGQLDLADLASVDPGRGRAAEASRGNC